jgi:hypothetical protein
MATTGAKVRNFTPKAGTTAPHQGPEVVVNLVEVTISMSAPFVFGVPLRLVNWVLERLGLVTEEELAELVEPGFEAKERTAAAARHPSAAKARKAVPPGKAA